MYNQVESVNGRKLAYCRSGDWQDEVIVFFHGFVGSKAYCLEAGSCCLVSFERFGIGQSQVVPYYSMEDFLEYVHEILQRHKVRSVKLIGHSAGGYYAQLFAQHFSDMVTSLTLVSSMIPINSPATKKIIDPSWKWTAFLTLKCKALSKFYFKRMAKAITNHYDKQLQHNLVTLSETERQLIKENHDVIKLAVLNAVANDGLGVYYDAYALCQKRDELKIPNHIPVYLWHGTKDETVPLSYVDYFESHYPVTKRHILDDLGHMLYLVHWQEIVRELGCHDDK